jgi:hypothetical protein
VGWVRCEAPGLFVLAPAEMCSRHGRDSRNVVCSLAKAIHNSLVCRRHFPWQARLFRLRLAIAWRNPYHARSLLRTPRRVRRGDLGEVDAFNQFLGGQLIERPGKILLVITR